MAEPDVATVFAELAKLKHEGIWKRRQITWRTNFVLWAALGAVVAVLYREAGTFPPGLFWWIAGVFIVVFVAHAWHWLGAFISDQKGMSWMHYYEQEAGRQLGIVPPDGEVKTRPESDQGWVYHLSQRQAWKKAQGFIAQIVVTAALMMLALLFLHSKASTPSKSLHEKTASIQDRVSGENLRIVLEKLPNARQPADP